MFRVMTSVFLLLIWGPTCWPNLLRRRVFSRVCWCVWDSSARSSAKSRSSSVSNSVHLIPLRWSSVVCRITQSITKLKRTADMTHPWRPPVLTWKFSCCFPRCRWSCGRSSWRSGRCTRESHRLSECAIDNLCGCCRRLSQSQQNWYTIAIQCTIQWCCAVWRSGLCIRALF